MPKFRPDNLNIHELAVEKPEKEFEIFFDPERDVTPQDWESIDKKLETLQDLSLNEEKDHLTVGAIELATFIKILGKSPTIKERMQDKFRKLTDNYIIEDSIWSYSEYSSYLTILGIEHKINEDEFVKIINLYASELLDNNPLGRARQAARIRMLDRDITIDEYETRRMEEELKRMIIRDHETVGNSFPHILKFDDMAAKMKINGINVSLDSKEWDMMHEHLKQHRKDGHWEAFAKLASHMAILSADEIKIPEGGGLKLVRYKDGQNLHSEISPLPEQKQF